MYKPKERTVSPKRSHLDATEDNPQPVGPRPLPEGFEVSSRTMRNTPSHFRTPHGFLGSINNQQKFKILLPGPDHLKQQ